MTEKSYLWTTGGAGDGASTYSRSDWGKIGKILAACRSFEGVAPEYLNKLAGTAPAANTARIASGGAMVDGKPYDSGAPVDVNIPSAVGVGNTRIDRVVLRASWAAQTVRITRIAGTDANTPAAPAITQTMETTYDVPLYQALVNVGGYVTLTDERVYADIGAGIIKHSMLAADAVEADNIKNGEITNAKLAADAVEADNIKNGEITNAKLAADAVEADNIKNGEITNAKLAADAVKAFNIKNGEITNTKMAQPKPYGCCATNSGSQNIPTYIDTESKLTLNAEEFDDDNMHDLVTNNSRVTIKRTGRYLVLGSILLEINPAGRVRTLAIKKNTDIHIAISSVPPVGNDWYARLNCAAYLSLESGDYLELYVVQDSGSTLYALYPRLSVVWDG